MDETYFENIEVMSIIAWISEIEEEDDILAACKFSFFAELMPWVEAPDPKFMPKFRT